MDKPRGYIHFESNGYSYWRLHVGRRVLPMSVFFAAYGVVMVALLTIFGIIAGVNNDGAWMYVPLAFLSLLGVFFVFAGATSLLNWMIKTVKEANY